MAYEVKDNTFSLFENDKKGNDKAPDYKGRGLFNGQEVRVAVWKRTSQSGIEYLSGTIEPAQKADAPLPEPAKEEQTQEIKGVIPDSEIPF